MLSTVLLSCYNSEKIKKTLKKKDINRPIFVFGTKSISLREILYLPCHILSSLQNTTGLGLYSSKDCAHSLAVSTVRTSFSCGKKTNSVQSNWSLENYANKNNIGNLSVQRGLEHLG